ncbi:MULTISPECIES: DUF2798 domain-containing protein [unclassified Acinetobacter]|uniref:DUF2798 domain-containing protein n=1 Tax=unclassified Acinetobacter TaxID=196816 RepID=UPI002934E377|nr:MULTISPECIES: DUF2798 domain-containing protein [unclassified Acinetobacter]WOE30342.1 DUF2798 domain-containing protein [Acinetobacter sp. SAAs470]WOE38533.1 DUF2798 domain-containing protein [Acinetobacter sp. SAAs474]
MKKIHHKHIFWIKPLILSCVMSGFISFTGIFFHESFSIAQLLKWLHHWGEAWVLAYPLLLLCLPLVEKILFRITR